MSSYTSSLLAAKAEALACLTAMMRRSSSETQVRLAAAAILRLPVPSEEASSAPAGNPCPSAPAQLQAPSALATVQPAPATHPTSRRAAVGSTPAQSPLTPDELAALARALPGVSPARFTRKHTPAYWRDVLARADPLATSRLKRAA